MKFKTTVLELKKAINNISPIINHNHSVLAFRYILIKKAGDKIEFKAYNDSSIGSGYVNYFEFEGEDVSAYILGKHLFSLINSFGKSEILFNIEEDYCSLKCGKSNYKLKLLEASIAKETLDDYEIPYEAPADAREVCFETDKFIAAYNSISHCISKDNAYKNLHNIFLVEDRMIACDKIKGATIKMEYGSPDGVSLHKTICDCIVNMDGKYQVKLYYFDDRVYGVCEGFKFISAVDNDYPYDSFKPIIDNFFENKATFDIKLKFDPEEIIDKLNRILILSDTDTNTVRVDFKGKELTLTVSGNAHGKEVINIFENLGQDDLDMLVDGLSLKDVLSKSMQNTYWYSNGDDSVQYVYDGSLLQFFMGLDD
ncbi:MAG: hypothetical protein AB7V50_09700 [Vampirovibrionia bacterium]